MSNLTNAPYVVSRDASVKPTRKPEPVLLLGDSRKPIGAKSFNLVNGKVTQRAFAFPAKYDVCRTAAPRDFDEMTAMLRHLLTAQGVHFTFGRVREGANLNAVSRTQVEGGGDIEDAPTSVLPIDTESILIEGGVDPKMDPQGAAELAYHLVTDAVPELEGAPCAVAFSNSAGFHGYEVEGGGTKTITTIRAHLWFFLDEPAYPSQIKARLAAANEVARRMHGDRLTDALIDLSIYRAGGVVFTSDPVLGPGVRDMILPGERMQVIKGDADWVALDVQPLESEGLRPRVNGVSQYQPNPELMHDEDKAVAAIMRIASRLANPDVDWWGYARVMGLLRNFGHTYNIRQSVIREAVHVWASKSGKYDTKSTDNLLNSYGRNQMNRVSLGELLTLERWSETDDAIYATMLADFNERTQAKYKSKLKPLAEGQGIARKNAWSQAEMERRAEREYAAIFVAYDYFRRFEAEFNKLLLDRVEKFNSGEMKAEHERRAKRIAAANPGMKSDKVNARAHAQMMAIERRKARKAALAAMEGGTESGKGRASVRLRKSIRRLLKWSAGVGKTTLFARHYVANERMRRDDYVNAYFHDTAAAERFISEVLEQARLAGVQESELNIRLIVGRSNTKRTGRPIAPCLKPKAAAAVGERGLNVYNSICRQLMAEDRDGTPIYDYCDHHPRGSSDSKCDFSGFFEDNRPGLRVFVHQNMPTTQPDEWKLPPPNFVLVDENFVSAMHEFIEIPIAWLWNESAYIDPDDIMFDQIDRHKRKAAGEQTSEHYKRRQALVEAAGYLRVALGEPGEPGLLKIGRLVADGFGDKIGLLIKAANKRAAQAYGTIRPSMTEADVLRVTGEDKGVNCGKVAKVLERLKSDLENLAGVGRSNSLWVNGDGIIRLEGHKTMRLRPNTSVLIIDADGSVDFARRVFGEDVMENVLRGERLGTVIQNFEGEQSKAYMTRLLCVEVSEEHAKRSGCSVEDAFHTPEVQAEIARRKKKSGRADSFYDELRETVRRQVALGMRVLIAVPKAVRQTMALYAKLYGGDTENDLLAHIPFQERVSENWFGARLTHPPVFVGSNEFKNFHAVHIVSREQPPLDAMKGIAGAYFHDDPGLDLESDTAMALRPYGLKNMNDVQVEVRVHPDSRVQYLMSLSREMKMLQAIDRLRLLRQNPERLLNGEMFTPCVYIHSNLPLDGLEVDQLVGGHEMRTYGGSPWSPALKRQTGAMPVGVIPLTGSWVHKHAGLMDADGGPMPLSTVKRLVAKLREEPRRAPDGAVVLKLRREVSPGQMEPIHALIALDVFLSRPAMIPSQVAVALAHENGFNGELPHVDWSRETHDQIDFGKILPVEVVDEASGELRVENRRVGGLGYFGASFGYGALSSVANEALYLVPTALNVASDPEKCRSAHSAQENPSPYSYRQSEPSDTDATLSATVSAGRKGKKATPAPAKPHPRDLLEGLEAAGVVPLRGSKGYAELASAVIGVRDKTIRDAASRNENLKSRWDAAVTLEGCTHMVTLKGGRYSTPARVTDDGSVGKGIELLIELECDEIKPIK